MCAYRSRARVSRAGFQRALCLLLCAAAAVRAVQQRPAEPASPPSSHARGARQLRPPGQVAASAGTAAGSLELTWSAVLGAQVIAQLGGVGLINVLDGGHGRVGPVLLSRLKWPYWMLRLRTMTHPPTRSAGLPCVPLHGRGRGPTRGRCQLLVGKTEPAPRPVHLHSGCSGLWGEGWAEKFDSDSVSLGAVSEPAAQRGSHGNAPAPLGSAGGQRRPRQH